MRNTVCSQELVLSKKLLILKTPQETFFFFTWKTSQEEQHFSYWTLKESYQLKLWPGCQCAKSQCTCEPTNSGPKWNPLTCSISEWLGPLRARQLSDLLYLKDHCQAMTKPGPLLKAPCLLRRCRHLTEHFTELEGEISQVPCTYSRCVWMCYRKVPGISWVLWIGKLGL